MPTSTRRRWLVEAGCRCIAVVLGSLLPALAAISQPSGTLAIVSDYRFRGATLSDDKPALQATLVLDAPGGSYGGAFGSTVKLPGTAHVSAQFAAFIGYAGRLPSGLHWDAGADYSAFSGTPEYNYAEVHAGVTSDDVNARIHFSPSYFALDSASFYAEINGTRPLSDRVSLLVHAGMLVPAGHSGSGVEHRPHPVTDVRAGINFQLSETGVQVAWVAATHAQAVYPGFDQNHRQTLIASVSRSF